MCCWPTWRCTFGGVHGNTCNSIMYKGGAARQPVRAVQVASSRRAHVRAVFMQTCSLFMGERECCSAFCLQSISQPIEELSNCCCYWLASNSTVGHSRVSHQTLLNNHLQSGNLSDDETRLLTCHLQSCVPASGLADWVASQTMIDSDVARMRFASAQIQELYRAAHCGARLTWCFYQLSVVIPFNLRLWLAFSVAVQLDGFALDGDQVVGLNGDSRASLESIAEAVKL